MMDEIGQWSAEEQAELRKVFFASAYELLDNLQDSLLAYESSPDADRLTVIKRAIHTLKGDSNSVGLTSVGDLCHRMEDVISSVLGARGEDRLDHDAIDLLLGCVDTNRSLLEKGETGQGQGDPGPMIDKIDRYLGREKHETGSPSPLLTEYEELQAREEARNGKQVFEVALTVHPSCAEKGVAARMAAQRLAGLGRIIRVVPAIESEEIDRTDRFTVIVATTQDRDALLRETAIAGIISEGVVREHRGAGPEGGAEETAARPLAPEQGPQHAAQSAQAEFLRIEATRVDRIMNLMGELIIGRSMIDQVTREMSASAGTGDAAARLRAANAYLERTISDLQKGVMRMRMVSVNQVFRKFPKMVRDLSAEKKKPVRLDIIGKETELDKGIVDSLGEPLAHIIRNMIDHGIEDPVERQRVGKPAEGVITLRAYHEASRMIIEASDDGRGMDTEKLKRRAVEKGFLRGEEAAGMAEYDAVQLIFLAGLSTADTVTETSGRGVGMDVVKAAVEGMRGTIDVHSTPGKGTMIRLRLPLTLAVIRTLLFEAGDKLFAVPVSVIAEVAKVMTSDLTTVNGRRTLMLRDQVVSIISVQELFQGGDSGEGKKFVLVLGAGDRKVGLLVDRLMWQQELVIKAIDGIPMQSGLVAGASILGSGKVVMILDALAVVRKAVDEERKRLTVV